MQSLITEKILWKTVSAGFGLICGIAIISFMTHLHFLFYSETVNTSEELAMLEGSLIKNPVFLTGKIISVFTGCFFAGAVTKLICPSIHVQAVIIAALILMIIGLIDLFITSYAIWFWFAALITYIPAAILGYYFISRIQTV